MFIIQINYLGEWNDIHSFDTLGEARHGLRCYQQNKSTSVEYRIKP